MLKEKLFKLKRFAYRPGVYAKFDSLLLSQALSADELEARQEAARQKIVQFAFENTAFYKRIYSAVGFQLGEMEHENWFENLPVLTKADLRDSFDEIVYERDRQFLRISTTGGSTGTPTKTGYDGRITEEAYPWRLMRWFGVNPWDDHAYVWRTTRHTKAARFKNAFQWWPTRHLTLDATFISETAIESFLMKCRRVKPTLLQGYVGAVSQVAQYVLDNHTSLEGWVPKVVWTTSAPLSPVQRKMIGEAFGAPVCDQYGSCEVRWIAQQCSECRGLHVNVEHVNVEFVDENNCSVRKGEYGRTLLTNLEDRVFPLIRYENGDRGRWLLEHCSCGRTLPCIDSVKGRESESFVLPSGRTINGEYLTTIFDASPDLVRGFRVVQHKDLSITIEYVPAGSEEAVRNVLKAFATNIGDEVPFEFKKVSEIPHDRGKLRFVVREK